jgi:hypothetical protein
MTSKLITDLIGIEFPEFIKLIDGFVMIKKISSRHTVIYRVEEIMDDGSFDEFDGEVARAQIVADGEKLEWHWLPNYDRTETVLKLSPIWPTALDVDAFRDWCIARLKKHGYLN